MFELIFRLSLVIKAASQIFLHSSPPTLSDGQYCPGSVVFTCRGSGVLPSLVWTVKGNNEAIFGYTTDITNPTTIPFTMPLPGVEVQITSAILQSSRTVIDITSTLTVDDVSTLSGFPVVCQSVSLRNETRNSIEIRPPPTSLTLSCSIFSNVGEAEVIFQWPFSFTVLHAVERYHVAVNPDPSSCSSNQLSPSEDYSCSGLSLGTNYSITISAINCENQEGTRDTLYLQAKSPVLSSDTVIKAQLVYHQVLLLNQLTVQWTIMHLPAPEICSYDTSLNYSVTLETIIGENIDQSVISSNSCNNGICLASFSNLSPVHHYRIIIRAVNIFGISNNSVSIDISNQVLGYSLFAVRGMIFALCTSPLAHVDNCSIQFSNSSSYENFSAPVTGPVNTPFFIESVTPNVTYHQATILINAFLEVRVRSMGASIVEVVDETESSIQVTPTYNVLGFTTDDDNNYKNTIVLEIYQLGLLASVSLLIIIALVLIIVCILLFTCLHKVKSVSHSDDVVVYRPEMRSSLREDLDNQGRESVVYDDIETTTFHRVSSSSNKFDFTLNEAYNMRSSKDCNN